jgi:hypothetical protein
MRSESMSTTGAEFGGPTYDITGNVYAAPTKKKITAPPMRYDLRMADASTVYQHIKELTKDDQAASQYLEQIKPALYSAAPKSIVFGYIPAPPNADITRQVIGTQGHFFKLTTTCCGAYFIWHDKTANTFLFWGPSTFKTVKAMNSIYWRIVKYYEMAKEEWQRQKQKQKQQQPQEEDDDDYSDLPDLVYYTGNTPDQQQEYDDDYSDMPVLISTGNTPDHEHPEQS